MARKRSSGPELDFNKAPAPSQAAAAVGIDPAKSGGDFSAPYYLTQRPVKFINIRVDQQFHLDCQLWQKIDFDHAQREDGYLEKISPEMLVFPC